MVIEPKIITLYHIIRKRMSKLIYNYKTGEIDEIDFQTLIDQNAILLDVRSEEEYDSISIEGSLNIPLDQLENYISKKNCLFVPNDKILVYCQSGIRSLYAKEFLISSGFEHTYNAGSWMNFEENEKDR